MNIIYKIMVALCLIVISACGRSPVTRFYTLQPALMDGAGVSGKTPYAVSVGQITLPDMVDRPQLVVRIADNRVEILETHRWAEPLKTEISRLIAENLRSQLGSDLISAYPQNVGVDADYRVLLDIQRFESIQGEGVVIDVFWSVRRTSGGAPRTGRTLARESIGSGGYDAMVAAFSRALGIVSGDIAKTIRENSPD